MDTISLWKFCMKDPILKKEFGGVFASDRLPNLKHIYTSFIVNLDPHDKPGSHWVALYFKKSICYYFCSYGTSPSNLNIVNFIKRNSKTVEWNVNLYQSLTTKTCGKFCLYFLIRMCRSEGLDLIPNLVSYNESVIKRFFKRISFLKNGKYINKLNMSNCVQLCHSRCNLN